MVDDDIPKKDPPPKDLELEKRIAEAEERESRKMALIPFYAFKWLRDNPAYANKESYKMAALIEVAKITVYGMMIYSVYNALTQ